MEKHLAELLGDIEHALAKYRSGTYGICDRCGNAIEAGRMEALPQASLCLACKSRHMKELRGRVDGQVISEILREKIRQLLK